MTKKYIHYGHRKFIKDLFQPITNCMWNKPDGGFWGSPLESTNGWKDWNEGSNYKTCSKKNSFIFELNDNAKVYYINSVDDLKNIPVQPLSELFKSTIIIDFEELIKQGYDAVEVSISNDRRLYWKLYGWDCDSILVLNPDAVKEM